MGKKVVVLASVFMIFFVPLVFACTPNCPPPSEAEQKAMEETITKIANDKKPEDVWKAEGGKIQEAIEKKKWDPVKLKNIFGKLTDGAVTTMPPGVGVAYITKTWSQGKVIAPHRADIHALSLLKSIKGGIDTKIDSSLRHLAGSLKEIALTQNKDTQDKDQVLTTTLVNNNGKVITVSLKGAQISLDLKASPPKLVIKSPNDELVASRTLEKKGDSYSIMGEKLMVTADGKVFDPEKKVGARPAQKATVYRNQGQSPVRQRAAYRAPPEGPGPTESINYESSAPRGKELRPNSMRWAAAAFDGDGGFNQNSVWNSLSSAGSITAGFGDEESEVESEASVGEKGFTVAGGLEGLSNYFGTNGFLEYLDSFFGRGSMKPVRQGSFRVAYGDEYVGNVRYGGI